MKVRTQSVKDRHQRGKNFEKTAGYRKKEKSTLTARPSSCQERRTLGNAGAQSETQKGVGNHFREQWAEEFQPEKDGGEFS